MIVPRYIGESGRSAFERGFEHLDQLATLSKKSHMLKHMLFQHENEDFSKVQWGMFILEYKKSAFERQISEAVTIEKVAKSSKILNSRSEWNQCQLPRLITRMGNQESEIRELEKELLEEKKIEEELENRIRKLRKERNKARLRNENTNARKKQKTSETNYISIREVWTCTKPRKVKFAETETDRDTTENPSKRTRTDEYKPEHTQSPPVSSSTTRSPQKRTPSRTNRMEGKITKNEIHLTNLRRVEDRIFEGQAITDFEVHVTDWDKVLEEHKIRLETETAERTARLQKQEAKQKSWQLYIECKTYLENNERNWELRRIERETEMKKKQRLSKANEQREKLLEKVR